MVVWLQTASASLLKMTSLSRPLCDRGSSELWRSGLDFGHALEEKDWLMEIEVDEGNKEGRP